MKLHSTKQAELQDWQACPDDELSRMLSRIRTQRRKRLMRRVAGVMSVVVCMVFVGDWALNNSDMNFPGSHKSNDRYLGGTTCTQVMEQMPSYIRGDLPEEILPSFLAHLELCPNCRQVYENKKRGLAMQQPVGHQVAGVQSPGLEVHLVGHLHHHSGHDCQMALALSRSEALFQDGLSQQVPTLLLAQSDSR